VSKVARSQCYLDLPMVISWEQIEATNQLLNQLTTKIMSTEKTEPKPKEKEKPDDGRAGWEKDRRERTEAQSKNTKGHTK
jgi:hypothetical protein